MTAARASSIAVGPAEAGTCDLGRAAANKGKSVRRASPSGEVYGEEGWREEELSAAELDTNAPELDELEAELDGPEITSETDEDPEW